MMGKPYSDKRWWDNPMPIDSLCSTCKYDRGFLKCDKYPNGIPQEIDEKSFPRPGKEVDKTYCKYREEKTAIKTNTELPDIYE